MGHGGEVRGEGLAAAADGLGGLFLEPDRVVGLRAGGAPGGDYVLVEIAGRDSIAAAVAVARQERQARLLPTVAYAGTEYGDAGSLLANVGRLRERVRPLGVEVVDPVVLGSPRWWWATIGRVNSVMARLYGPWHICVGCHMYLHAVRAPLAWEAGAARQVAGERLRHRGRTKINQTRPAVDAYRRVLAGLGIRLEMPLLELDDEGAIESLAGDWGEGERQPDCVLSGNYLETGGRVEYEEGLLVSYLDEYLVPVTSLILRSLKETGRADYGDAVAEVLGGLGGGGWT